MELYAEFYMYQSKRNFNSQIFLFSYQIQQLHRFKGFILRVS